MPRTKKPDGVNPWMQFLGDFIRISADSGKKGFPYSQYYYTNGHVTRRGFTCGGYHFWKEIVEETDGEHFEIGPISATASKKHGHLIDFPGVVLPFDEVKASMVTSRKLGFYWAQEGDVKFEHADEETWHWNCTINLYVFDDGRVLWDNSGKCWWDYESEPVGSGKMWFINVPGGSRLNGAKPAFLATVKSVGNPPCLVVEHPNYHGTIALAWYKSGSSEMREFDFCGNTYILERNVDKFTMKRKEKQMNFENIDQLGSDLKKRGEKTAEQTPETTVPPVEAEEEQKPAEVPAEPVQEPVQEPAAEAPVEAAPEKTLAEVLTELLNAASTIREMSSALVKGLKPIARQIERLEKHSANPAELKEASAKIKTLEAENARLKGLTKQLAEQLATKL